MTQLQYLDDTYRYSGESDIEDISSDERGTYIVTRETVFYPQGGGQPADKGTIQAGHAIIPVSFVGFTEGKVRHYIAESDSVALQPGQNVSFHVDGENRQMNARLHTAGHLVSHVIETLHSSLMPIKGYHFQDGSYVEFSGEMAGDTALLIEAANDRLRTDIDAGLAVKQEYADYAKIEALRPHLAPHIPKNKPSRIVTIGSYVAVPCGGTHVSTIAELCTVRITKIKNQKGNLKVSYSLT
jgi:alanyl-tRNA synthetase